MTFGVLHVLTLTVPRACFYALLLTATNLDGSCKCEYYLQYMVSVVAGGCSRECIVHLPKELLKYVLGPHTLVRVCCLLVYIEWYGFE